MEIVIEGQKLSKPLNECEPGFYLREDDSKVIFNVFKINDVRYYQVIHNSHIKEFSTNVCKLSASATAHVIPLSLKKVIFECIS